MNKVITSLVFVSLFISGICLYKTCFDTEIGYVDINKLLEGYKRASTERMILQDKIIKAKSKTDSLQFKFQEKLQAFERDKSDLTDEELQGRKSELQSQKRIFENFREGVQKKLRKEDQEVTQTILNLINDYVKAYGEDNGYDIILGAKGDGSLMYARGKIDLTQEVLEKMNKGLDEE